MGRFHISAIFGQCWLAEQEQKIKTFERGQTGLTSIKERMLKKEWMKNMKGEKMSAYKSTMKLKNPTMRWTKPLGLQIERWSRTVPKSTGNVRACVSKISSNSLIARQSLLSIYSSLLLFAMREQEERKWDMVIVWQLILFVSMYC